MKIKVMKKILEHGEKTAEELRELLKSKGILYLNLMSSPGSGKTTIIERTVSSLPEFKFGVIEGDIQTTLDAERMATLGVKTYQINTGPFGGDCHLEAPWVATGIHEMKVDGLDILFVENIGNLVCPAEFDIGAHYNTVVLSVTEGEDKPLKYPLAFRVSQVVIVSKIDLLPHLDVSLNKIEENIKKVNPSIKIIPLSAKTGEGFDRWLDFLRKSRNFQ